MRVLHRDWLAEAILLIALAVVSAVVFAFTPLDLAAARQFYHAAGPDHWPLGNQWPWFFLYRLAPLITASLLALGLIWLLLAHLHRHEAWRMNGVFLILSVVIGPGLLINMVFKDHWDRPQPRDIVQFGGTLQYTPAPLRGEGGGSFPCGHCSVGLLYASGWWLWKRRRPAWARASLGMGLTAGTVLGVGRMAAGAHFLSDVIWSALIAFGVVHVLYYHVLRLPAREVARPATSSDQLAWVPGARMLTMLSIMGAALILMALFVTPHGGPFSTRVDLSLLSPLPRVLEVSARTANLNIVIGDHPHAQLLVDGELHGFGLPTSRLDASSEFHADPVPILIYRIEERGLITDLDASATFHVAPGDLKRIVVRLQRGNIRVTDTTQDHVVSSGRLRLDLRTAAGHIQRPER